MTVLSTLRRRSRRRRVRWWLGTKDGRGNRRCNEGTCQTLIIHKLLGLVAMNARIREVIMLVLGTEKEIMSTKKCRDCMYPSTPVDACSNDTPFEYYGRRVKSGAHNNINENGGMVVSFVSTHVWNIAWVPLNSNWIHLTLDKDCGSRSCWAV